MQNWFIQLYPSLDLNDLSCLGAQATTGVADGGGEDSDLKVTVGPLLVVYGQGLYGEAVEDATE